MSTLLAVGPDNLDRTKGLSTAAKAALPSTYDGKKEKKKNLIQVKSDKRNSRAWPFKNQEYLGEEIAAQGRAAMQSAVFSRPPIPLFSHHKTTTAAAAAISASLPRKHQNAKKQQQQQQQDFPIKSNLQQEITAAIISSKDHTKEESSGLRGSDVLLALQRAATQKKKQQQPKKARWNGGAAGARAAEAEQDLNYINVQPINIRADWMERIDGLAKRVQELKSQYHY